MTEQQQVCLLKEGDNFTGFLLAQEVAFKTSSKGSEYLELKLVDVSGSIKAFLWDIRAIEGNIDQITADAFLKIKGQISSYNGRVQLRLDKLRFAEDQEVGDFSQFFPVSKRSIEEMVIELNNAIKSINDQWIKKILEAFFIKDKNFFETFCKAPAAKSFHHAYLGGLIEHTLSVLKLADMACTHYIGMNRDLVMAGVLLHDIGKIAELTYQRSFNYSDVGNLIGHISIAADWINQAIRQIPNFPEELRLMILHTVLSHHGKLEYGSPVVPKIPEALLVHYLDDLDAKLEVALRSVSEDYNNQGSWTPFLKSFDCMFYKSRWPKDTNQEEHNYGSIGY